MKIYAASVMATDRETKEAYHELFSFSLRQDSELTPEQHAALMAQSILPKADLDCRLRVMPIDIAKHYQAGEFQEKSSKEA